MTMYLEIFNDWVDETAGNIWLNEGNGTQLSFRVKEEGVVVQSPFDITIYLRSGTGTLLGTLTRTSAQQPAGAPYYSAYAAVFDDIYMTVAGVKKIDATAPGVLGSSILDNGVAERGSGYHSILALTVNKVAFVQQPTDTKQAVSISPAITVQLQDIYGNNISTSGVSISAALTTGTGTLNGTLTQLTNANGLSTFNNLSIDLIGSKNLTASSPNLTSAISSPFIITPDKVVFTQQPTNAVANISINPAVTVQIKDGSNNNISTSGVSISMALTTGNGTLNGTLTQLTNANGLSTFNNLSINQITSKQLTASSPGSTSAISNAFNIYAFQKNGVPISPAAAAPVLTLTKL